MSSWAHGQAFIPCADTPTMRRAPSAVAVASPKSPYISWVAMSVTGVRRSTG